MSIKMGSKKITLSVPEQILNKLNEEKKKYAYSSVQEIIVAILRDRFYKK